MGFSLPNIKSESTLDYILIALFVLFLILQIEIPAFLAEMIDTPVGIATVIIVALYMFLYTNPILGVLSLIVAYEILRRSSKKTGRYALTQYLPTQTTRDTEMRAMNPVKKVTLEEDIVAKMAPIGVSNQSGEVIDTPFRPVSEETHSASAL